MVFVYLRDCFFFSVDNLQKIFCVHRKVLPYLQWPLNGWSCCGTARIRCCWKHGYRQILGAHCSAILAWLMTQARESPVSRNKVSSGLHTCTPMYTYTSIQKTDQKINFQFVLLKGHAFHCFCNSGVYKTMMRDHKNSREDTAAGVAMAILQREHRMICYQVLLWGGE